jgi:hypothetical protein
MKLVFIYGLPATGKLTVAQELACLTGYKLFHNHLVVDLLLSTFEFGSASFVELREEIWLSVFLQAGRSQLEGLIFTFNPETTVRETFVDQAVDTVVRGGGQIDFIELVCPLDELRSRLNTPERLQFRKLSSLPLFEQLHAGGVFDTSHMPSPSLTIDTSLCVPADAALRIAQKLEIPRANSSVALGVSMP